MKKVQATIGHCLVRFSLIVFIFGFGITLNAQLAGVLPDPGNLTSFRNQTGQTFSFRVRGTDSGTVWGGANGIYTDDSNLGKAAVHAGLLRIGEEGVVTVTTSGGQSSYFGNTQNGIASVNYGSFPWCFRFVNATSTNTVSTPPVANVPVGSGAAMNDPGNLTAYRGKNSQTFMFRVRGTDAGSVWGGANGIYTDDSGLGRAAVHAGLLRMGEEGVVVVNILAGQPAYTGNTQNGIASINYGSFAGSFRFVHAGASYSGISAPVVPVPVATTPVAVGQILPDPGNLTGFRNQAFQTLTFRVRGTDAGSVWGGANGIYTDDSLLGKAAVHAGLLKIGEEGNITVTTMAGQPSYGGSTQNGISSVNYGSFQWSFRFK